MIRHKVIAALVTFGVQGCASTQLSTDYELKQNKARHWAVNNFHKLELPKSPGVSGLTRFGEKGFFSVAERDSALLHFTPESLADNRAHANITIQGVSRGLDLEGLVAVDENEFWVGTESREKNPKFDRIYRLQRTQGVASVTEELRLPYKIFKKAPTDLDRSNRGIEGLCRTDRFLYVATEAPITLESEVRHAAIGRYDFEMKNWTAVYVKLQSDEGKLSALSCYSTPNSSKTELFAIERHYKIALVLQMQVPDELPDEAVISPEVILDLSHFFSRNPNFEGLQVANPSHVWVISDNQSSVIQGSTIWMELELNTLSPQ